MPLKILGYDFVSAAPLKIFRHQDFIIDDYPSVRINHEPRAAGSGKGKSGKLFEGRRKSQPSARQGHGANAKDTEPIAEEEDSLSSRCMSLDITQCAPTTAQYAAAALVQRCVLVRRDDTNCAAVDNAPDGGVAKPTPLGFGFTLSGEAPVAVKSVVTGGPAWAAGVRQGDRLIKVNGIPVHDSSHVQVVAMIAGGGTQVALTVLGRPAAPLSPSWALRGDESAEVDNELHQQQRLDNRREPQFVPKPPKITGPRPLNESAAAEWRRKRRDIIKQMLDEEKRNLEQLERADQWPTANDDPARARQLMDQAKKRIANLQTQLNECGKQQQHVMPQQKHSMQTAASDAVVADRTRKVSVDVNRQEKPVVTSTAVPPPLLHPEVRLRAGGRQQASAALPPPPPTMQRCQSSVDNTLALAAQLQHGAAAPALSAASSKSTLTALHQDGDAVSAGSITPLADQLSFAGNEHSGQVVRQPIPLRPLSIKPMEITDSESDEQDESVAPLECDGPFGNFADLKARPAHLAVFLHYLVSNSNPASLLFYLIVDLYQAASGKELKRWAYEIHSTFTMPNSPLAVPCASEPEIYSAIDSVLENAAIPSQRTGIDEMQDPLRLIFVPARRRVLDDINERLGDFKQKRAQKLSEIYGEPLLESIPPGGDKAREHKIIDYLLMVHFDNSLRECNGDLDALKPKDQAMLSALATVVKQHFGVRPSATSHERVLDKCPTFLTKERGNFFKIRSMASRRTVTLRGHALTLQPVSQAAFCAQCGEPIWGVQPQAYFCANCDLVLHKQCAGTLEGTCVGATPTGPIGAAAAANRQRSNAKRGNRSTPTLQAPAGTESPTQHVVIGDGKVTRYPPTFEANASDTSGDEQDISMEQAQSQNRSYSPPASGNVSIGADSGYYGSGHPDGTHNLSAHDERAAIIARSQSMRTRDDILRQSKRDSSNPSNLVGNRRAKSDVDAHDKSIALAVGSPPANVTGYSAAGCDDDDLGPPTGAPPPPPSGVTASSSSTSSLQTTSEAGPSGAKLSEHTGDAHGDGDSDIDLEQDAPSLEDHIGAELLKRLKPKERKRQEIINELLHTERTHLRNLKVLWRVFALPMRQLNQWPELHQLLFAELDEIIDLHCRLVAAIKVSIAYWKDTISDGLYGHVGPMLEDFLCGDTGQRLQRAAARHCERQQHALVMLRETTKSDSALAAFLAEAECKSVCRKLQLKDMIPMEMQRLTKYPLLLETVAKYSAEPSEELDSVNRAVKLSKNLLDTVNEAKRAAENRQRLSDLQARLDTSNFDREQHKVARQFKNLDLTKYTLVHDGMLTWRLARNKLVEVHVVLLEELLIFLLPSTDGQKLILKYYDTREAKKCPILSLSSLMIKDVAIDKKAFFVVSMYACRPQIYELAASSHSERRVWFKVISDQVNIAKQKEGVAVTSVVVAPDALNDSGVSTASGDEAGGQASAGLAHTSLVNPCEIRVAQPKVLYEQAEAVMTPAERMARADRQLVELIAAKQRIVADAFIRSDAAAVESSVEALNRLTDELADKPITELKQSTGGRELLMACIVQTNRLLDAINEGIRIDATPTANVQSPSDTANGNSQATGAGAAAPVTPAVYCEPSVPCLKLTAIVAPLLKQLTALTHALNQSDDELKKLKLELQRYKELHDSPSTSELSRQRSSLNVPPGGVSGGNSPSPIPSPLAAGPAGGGIGGKISSASGSTSSPLGSPMNPTSTRPGDAPASPRLPTRHSDQQSLSHSASSQSTLQSAQHQAHGDACGGAARLVGNGGGATDTCRSRSPSSGGSESPGPGGALLSDSERKQRRLNKRQRNQQLAQQHQQQHVNGAKGQ